MSRENPHTDLTNEIMHGRLSVQQAIGRIANERDKDLAGFQVPCEAPSCGQLFDVQDAWSGVFWLAFPGHRTVTGFQLSEGNGVYPHQHFCCSEACLEACVIQCFREHYQPEAVNRRIPDNGQQQSDAE